MASKHGRPASKGGRVAGAVVATVAVAAVAASTLVLVNHFASESSNAETVSAAGESGHGAAPSAATSPKSAPSSTPPPLVPLRVVGVSPDGTAPVNGTEPVVVTFNEPVSTDTLPTISPATPGSWTASSPTTLQFIPETPFVPDAKLTVEVPAAMRSVAGAELASSTSVTFRVTDGSLLRLQELLAELNYLPVSFASDTPETDTAAAQGAMAFNPPQGTFAMRFSSTPQALAALWKAGSDTPVTKGAIMAFENVHDLAVDGVAGPAVWTALLRDAVTQTVNPRPYTWAWATKTHPETLRIWSDGAFVFSTAANTGIPAAPTPVGSWPVFARYLSQTMKGTNPDGTKYNDPGVPYINYFYQGDAIHGFERASYGTEQSLGCVELPYAAAAKVWNLINYGTVVTITT